MTAFSGRWSETPEQFRVRSLINVQQWTAQLIHAERMERQHADLDMREDEALRMFGVAVEYVQDERVIEVG